MKFRWSSVALALAASALIVAPARAQVTGSIAGIVHDATGTTGQVSYGFYPHNTRQRNRGFTNA